jgi:hypothetical protein
MRLLSAFCFFLISFKISGQINIDSTSIPLKIQSNHVEVKIRLHCLATSQFSLEPLYIIDGIAAEPEVLRDIKPDDIEKIDVLKGFKAVGFFGCQPNNGVIIITTKKSNRRKFLIKDKLNESGLPGATITFVLLDENHDTLRFASDDDGEIVTNKLQIGKTYQITVTSTGYKQLSFHYKAGIEPKETFFMERNTRECMPVIVQSPNFRTIRCGMYKLVVRCEKENESDPKFQNSVVIYPNPVNKGKILIVDMKGFHSSSIVIKLFNAGGQEIYSEAHSKKNNVKTVPISIDSRWRSGIYFIQITDEKMNRVKSDKIIIE